ncbi:hypothetical protein [Nesterenkonia sp. K-15-9-6]|uniref:hypothetical protein n=1 Tax=Nesterenkonia sp. K-15-9-6 TaxID=3093918 RepID=UPI0040449682
MTPAEANALLAYARGLDNLIPNTDANADTWARSLASIPLEAGRVIVQDYYGRHHSPDEMKPITPAQVRRLYQNRAASFEAKQRATKALPRPSKKGPPRRFIEQMQRLGYLTDRDKAQYRP